MASVLYRLALRYFGPRVALVAAISLPFLAAHFWNSQIGFVDHPVAIALGSTLLLGSGMSLLRRFEESDVVPPQAWRVVAPPEFGSWPGPVHREARGAATGALSCARRIPAGPGTDSTPIRNRRSVG